MFRKNFILLTILVAILVFSIVALVFPLFGRDSMRLGLDLKGGLYLEYQVQYPEGTTADEQATLMERALAVIRTRIDQFGITEPVVQSLGTERVIVQLPGFSDVDQAKSLVEQTGFLEFREVELDSSGNPVYISDYLDQTSLAFVDATETGERYFVDSSGKLAVILKTDGEGNLIFVDASGNTVDVATLKAGNVQELSWIAARGSDNVQLTGSLLNEAAAEVSTQTTGATADVKIEWNSEGTTIFDQVAARLYSRPAGSVQRDLGIFLDQSLISAPEIQEQQYGGNAVITGNFTLESATNLANLLSSGSLPMPLQKPPIYEDTVSASLGANFTEMAVLAGILGTVMVMLFMIIYYRIPGAMASLALLFYGAVLLAIFKLVPITLSLPGIGGFVLSVGMAVDANVLIFERLKEELRAGRTLGAAVEAGFDRAWLAIRDSNITTFISCIVLYWIGGLIPNGEPVKGFALTLFIGALVSIFTAIVVTRTLLRMFVGTSISKKTALFSAFLGRK